MSGRAVGRAHPPARWKALLRQALHGGLRIAEEESHGFSGVQIYAGLPSEVAREREEFFSWTIDPEGRCWRMWYVVIDWIRAKRKHRKEHPEVLQAVRRAAKGMRRALVQQKWIECKDLFEEASRWTQALVIALLKAPAQVGLPLWERQQEQQERKENFFQVMRRLEAQGLSRLELLNHPEAVKACPVLRTRQEWIAELYGPGKAGRPETA